jgi:putative tricarboxylic transport membrane protein
MKKPDLLLSFILLAVTFGASMEIRNLPIGSFGTPGAGFFPLLVTILLGLLSVVLLAQSLREKGNKRGSGSNVWGEWKNVTLTVACLLGFIVFFERLGFLISTFLLMAFLLYVVGRRKLTLTMATALVSAFVCHLLFNSLLNASLPMGILSGLLGN